MIAGRVGSLLGLKPYSSTSFRLASSCVFLCLRFLQKNRPAKTSSATTTTGTTTATAVFPPAESPPEELVLSFVPEREAPPVDEADADEDVVDDVEAAAAVFEGVAVTTTVTGASDDSPETVGVSVMTEVTRSVDAARVVEAVTVEEAVLVEEGSTVVVLPAAIEDETTEEREDATEDENED